MFLWCGRFVGSLNYWRKKMKNPVNIIVNGSNVIHVVFSDNSVYRFNYKRRIYQFKFWLLTGMSLTKVLGNTEILMLNINSQKLSKDGR